LPLLSAGISTRRVVRPVLISACALVCVNIANQELLIPLLGSIPVSKDDPKHEKPVFVNGEYDGNVVLLTGRAAVRQDLQIIDFTCTLPPTLANGKLLHLHSREAFYVPPGNSPQTGGWLMTQTEGPEHEEWTRANVLEQIDTGKYFLRTRVDFERLTQD